ncbi:Nuclear actin-protein involved in chromatin remodeling [Entomortierella chlamydospora]|uniref:Nuclear actin-protein involved in chromatin remodeling n=1 Tax=Entomortierella chlamydospora TaxID=101097 RepID=A0A9P6T143_9FUNG|nr:Nuclear actin-protein involved in chromatin remodeling [Entomortierella chlamydospora]
MAKQRADMDVDMDADVVMNEEMEEDMDNVTLYPILTEKQYTPTPDYSDYSEHFAATGTALVIDNGSWQCRAGWATEERPRLSFDNQTAKFRDRKANVSSTYVGNDVYADVLARSNARTAFDGAIMCNPEIMETVLDYIFIKLGIDAEKIDHPVVMTEAVCVPLYNRNLMSELLFESYQIPSVAYGIDSLFSMYANGPERSRNGIVVSAGHHYSHVIPVSDGKVYLEHAKRISYGGVPASEYMLKLMQMKYPTFPMKMTTTQSETLLINHTYVAHDYLAELASYEDPKIFQSKDRVIQFPFVAPVVEEKSEEEQARLAAKRKEQGRRLQEQAAKARLEKLIQREQDLEQYTALKNSRSTLKKAEWMEQLKSMGFKEESDLDAAIKTTDAAIKRARNKELGIEEEEKEPPTFPLLEIPDEELSEADRKEKKKQRLLKASYDARMRAKAAKAEETAYQEELARLDEEKREREPQRWLEELHTKRKELVDKIKAKKQLREQLSDRRSHASQLRMKSIAALASDSPPPKRRRKGQDEDTFGQDDEDWMVYREISREDDSEDEEEASQLNEYEQKLLKYDPGFLQEHTMNAYTPKNSFLHYYTNGLGPYDPAVGLSLEQTYQLHVNVERIRVPEVLFQPGIIGLDQTGLVETIQDVLKRFDAQARERLVQNIFVTGGMAQVPGLIDRLDSSIRSILPFSPDKKIYEVRRARDCLVDAWRGAAMVGRDSDQMKKILVTRQEYEEMVTFNCVGYPSTPGGVFGVSIAGVVHKLATNEDTFPVWSGAVPGTTGSVEYSYVELNAQGAALKTEAFVRRLANQSDTATMNEFFERPVTVWELPKIPYTYLATYPSKTRAFKQKQIATIHVTAPVAMISEMNANPKNDKDYKVTTFRFINSEMIYNQRNITFSTSGKSSKEFAKQSFKFEFDTDYNQTFFSRPNIKLRSMAQDPAMIREKLYIDMLNSVGVPTQQGAYVRLFVNNEPYGLYLMVDDIKKSFVKQTIHGGDPLINRGSLVQMNAWINKADLVYKGPDTANYDQNSYTSKNLGNNPPTNPLQELIAFMSDLQSFDPISTPDPVGYWNNTRLDLDGVMRCMALEYLMGGFDMYWYSASNYFMYKNPTLAPNGGKWQFIPTDMDNTFGSGYPTSTLPTYRNYVDFAALGERPLVQKLILQNPQINALFEQTLKEIISTAFKPEAIGARAKAYNQMLSLDAQWDLSLKRMSPGNDKNFTFADFNTNLYNVTKDMQAGVLGWVEDMTNLVAAELKFTIPQGLVDRVPPPPKKGEQGNPEEEENDSVVEVPDKADSVSAGSLDNKAGIVTQWIAASAVVLALFL